MDEPIAMIKLDIEGFTSVYKELAEIIGAESTYEIYKRMKGQQITFPKHLYSTEFVLEQIKKEKDKSAVKKLAVEYDFTEKYLKQLLRKQDIDKETKSS